MTLIIFNNILLYVCNSEYGAQSSHWFLKGVQFIT